ncbi:hypothetical protein ABK040_015720 [Willaertia magna]
MFSLMMKENIHSLNEIFKRNEITLNESFPNYLFHLNNLYIQNQKENLQLLQSFTNLKYLTLYKCQFEDKHLQHLQLLENLHLYSCKNLLGECFKEFKQLKTLELGEMKLKDDSLIILNNINTLDIVGCYNITGKCLQNFSQLTQLIYEGTSSTIITHLNSLQNLKILHLTVYEPDEKCPFNLENLEELQLAFERSCFINLQNLQHLFISEFENDELEEENLQYLTNIKILDCKCVTISAKYLSNLKKLKELTFTPNDEFKEEYLKDLTLLKRLSLEKDCDEDIMNVSKFTGKCLTNLINLTELRIPHSKVEDRYLMKLTKLEVLDVSNCKTITGECLLNLNNLQTLFIDKTNIHEKYLQNLKNLTNLHVSDCNNIILGKFLLQMDKLNYFYCFGWFYTAQINDIKLNINKGMIFLNALYDVLNKNEKTNYIQSFTQDKAIDEIQEIYNELLEKDKEIILLKEVIQEKDNMMEEKEEEIKQLKLIISSYKKTE